MKHSLTELGELGVFAPLDRHFATRLSSLAESSDQDVELALALSSRRTREGHVCVDLAQAAGTRLTDGTGAELPGATLPSLERWCAALAQSRLVSTPEQVLEGRVTPLVLADQRLYLYRYFQHEQRLFELIGERLEPQPLADPVRARRVLDQLFPERHAEDWQRLAVELAALRRFSVISGGPGTGKTSSVVKLLALLCEDARAAKRSFRVLLLAPTGKAAARLIEAVQRAKQGLKLSPEVAAAIPDEAATIHRALGISRGSARPRHHRDNPLLADLVLVDEASMVDVALMRRLLEAVPSSARLVLLGDRHQLSSVEAGAVLADLCGDAGEPRYSPTLAASVHEIFGDQLPSAASVPAIADSLVVLTRSYRFRDDSGIGALARAIRLGEAEQAWRLLAESGAELAAEPSHTGHELSEALAHSVVSGFGPALGAASPEEALARFDALRVLCAHRRGPFGVEALNAAIERALERAGLLNASQRFYRGRPLLVTENDYQLGLYNGDVGIVFGEGERLRAYFASAGGVRELSLARLPAHETVFAMSVHKSQGSEFDEIQLVLPEPGSPLLTRELLYTAVTRARRRVVVHAARESVITAVETRVRRASGLYGLFWGE